MRSQSTVYQGQRGLPGFVDEYTQIASTTYNLPREPCAGVGRAINLTGEGQIILQPYQGDAVLERRRRSALHADVPLQLSVIAQSKGIPAGWRRESSARIIGFPGPLPGNPIFFERRSHMAISILTSDQHRSVAVDTRARPEYGDTVNRAVALSAEFNELHREYPLLLRKTNEEPGFVAAGT